MASIIEGKNYTEDDFPIPDPPEATLPDGGKILINDWIPHCPPDDCVYVSLNGILEKEPPRRKFHLKLSLEADSIEEMEAALESIIINVCKERIPASVAGGCNSGWFYKVKENPDMTREKYFEETYKFYGKQPSADVRPENSKEK